MRGGGRGKREAREGCSATWPRHRTCAALEGREAASCTHAHSKKTEGSARLAMGESTEHRRSAGSGCGSERFEFERRPNA
jgi:hypothetical protein